MPAIVDCASTGDDFMGNLWDEIMPMVDIIQKTVAGVVLLCGLVISGVIGAIIATTISGINMLVTSILGIGSWLYGLIPPIVIDLGIWIWEKAKWIKDGITYVLEIIHFDIILKIHNLAYIFSSDYREMMQKIYNEIRKVSEALGLGADFITFLLEDAKDVVMDVSSLMGQSYDLSEVGWLNTMNDYLGDFSQKAEQYENNPGALITDMAEYIKKPSIDAKSIHQRNLLTLLNGTIEVADGVVGKTVKLREDLDQAILHLPKSISKDIYEQINPHLESFDRFIYDEYQPVARDLTNAIHVLDDTTARQNDKLGVLTNNILNPGDLMGNIDNLSELERIRQEGKIAEIVNRAPVRSSKDVNTKIDAAQKGLKEIYEALIKVREKPPYHVPEVAGLQYKPGIIPALRKTWFVGNF